MSQTEGGPDPHQGGRPSVLSLNIREKSALYAAHIPQLKNGGSFIPTARAHQLGDEVFMLVSLPDDPTKMPVSGRVVWITPADAQGKRPRRRRSVLGRRGRPVGQEEDRESARGDARGHEAYPHVLSAEPLVA